MTIKLSDRGESTHISSMCVCMKKGGVEEAVIIGGEKEKAITG
jgi:hypothetical protein